MIGCTNFPTRKHDTALHILATKQFTVNLISEAFVENANFACVDFPIDHSEWPTTGLTMAESVRDHQPILPFLYESITKDFRLGIRQTTQGERKCL